MKDSTKFRFRMIMAIFLAFIFIAIGSLYALGIYLSHKCYSVGQCDQCWNALNSTEATNAYVNLTLCACAIASSDDYSDREMNNRIVGMYKAMYDYDASVQEICEGMVPLTFIEE